MSLSDNDQCPIHGVSLVDAPGPDVDPASPATRPFRQCPACQAAFVAALDRD